jgi:ferredoxin
MTCVVTERCIGCRYGECVTACPVDAFRVGPNFVVIEPELCVNCTTCTLVCPIGAIVPTYELPKDQRHIVEVNARLAKAYPKATVPVSSLPGADDMAMETRKMHLLLPVTKN